MLSLCSSTFFLICFQIRIYVQVVENKPVYTIASAFRVLIMHLFFLAALLLFLTRFNSKSDSLPSLVCPSLFLGCDSVSSWSLLVFLHGSNVVFRLRYSHFKRQFSSATTKQKKEWNNERTPIFLLPLRCVIIISALVQLSSLPKSW